MIESICHELQNRVGYLEGHVINTIYFGGGTPSLLTETELSAILDSIRASYAVRETAEITLEANPDDITDEYLERWKSVGVNRLSIGLQSFRALDLDWMNRAHTVEEALSCVERAQQAGFENLTVDLIYGLPNLSMEEWEGHVRKVVEMKVPHLSAYCLTVENKTALNNWVKKGRIDVGSEDDQSEQFVRLLEIMEENGYEQYEISNFCKPGLESQHNSNYWKGEWYLGVGPSAHAFNGISRSWNISNNQQYIKAISADEPYFEIEVLSKEDQFNEAILTGLRTSYGVQLKNLDSELAESEEFVKKYQQFIECGWMLKNGEVLVLSKEGKLRADHIASELFVENE